MRHRTIYRQRDNPAMLSIKLAGLKKGKRVTGQRAKDPSPPTVIVIDDDSGVRESIGRLLRSAGFQVHVLSSVNEFLDTDLPEGPTCLVLDVRLPGQSGLELQRQLMMDHPDLPIVFITAQEDENCRRQALQVGAVAFLYKPFSEQDLLKAIDTAVNEPGDKQ